MIRHLNDPEHPLSLEQLKVAALEHVRVDDARNTGAHDARGGGSLGLLGRKSEHGIADA